MSTSNIAMAIIINHIDMINEAIEEMKTDMRMETNIEGEEPCNAKSFRRREQGGRA